jgi:hypothetical protein
MQKICLYTVITGNYDKNIQYKFSKEVFPFIDTAFFVCDDVEQCEYAKANGWDIIQVKTTDNPKKYQRSLKVLANFHKDLKVLNDFDVILYHDGNNMIYNVNNLLKSLQLLNENDLICYAHPDRTNVIQEIDELVRVRIITSEQNACVKKVFNVENFKDNVGLTETRVLIRKNNEKMKQFAETWFDYMNKTDIWRDQSFFNFSLWKTNAKYEILPNNEFPFVCSTLHVDPKRIRSIKYYTKGDIDPNIQLDIDVINDIVHKTRTNPNIKMLVFGLGYDSHLWYKETKNVYFIEHDLKYIKLNKDIPSENIIFYEYNNIDVKTSLNNIDNIMYLENFEVPTKLKNLGKFDIILIDGPPGYNYETPGRLLPIYWSKKFLTHSNSVVYVDDIMRPLENGSVKEYFSDYQSFLFTARDGCLKISENIFKKY